MTNKFMSFLENKLMPIGGRLGSQKHLLAVRDGVVATMPLTIIGGITLIVANPPIDPTQADKSNIFLKPFIAWANWAAANSNTLLTPYNMTMGLMAIFCAFGVAYSLAKSYKLDGFSSAIISAVVFLMVSGSSTSAVLASDVAKGGAALKNVVTVLPASYFTSQGMFTAIIVGLITVEITRFITSKGFTIKMPDGVPPAVADSFSSLIPMIANILIFYIANLIIVSKTGMTFPEALMKVLAPAIGGINSLGGTLILILICQVFWLIGIHGANLIYSVYASVSLSTLAANAASRAAGHPMVHIFTDPYWNNYIFFAGSGCTIALVLMYLRSRSEQLKTLGKLSILPAIFNINEPVLFGSPIVLNPILGIPFILVPLVNAVLSYIATASGIVAKFFIETPWTTPAPIGAILSSMDVKAGILVIVLIAIDYVIYYPFFKVFEKSLLKNEEASAQGEAAIS